MSNTANEQAHLVQGHRLATETTPTSPATTLPSTAPTHVVDYIDSLHPHLGVWVDGQGRAAKNGELFPVTDPATGATIAEISDADSRDAIAAVDAAAEALPAWSAVSTRDRSDVLNQAFHLMHADAEHLATLICLENGKSLSDARGEVAYAAEFFRWYAEEAVRGDGAYGPSPTGGSRTFVTHRPVGVAALITPWNFPAAMATRKIAPALAAGCSVVLKPAAQTPLTALAIARILENAGVPAGVVNVVPTTAAQTVVTTWLEDSRVRKLSFTGSTHVGRTLLRQAADRVVNASMELGGNAPFIVASDADVPAAVEGALIAKFRNSGQACTAANRFYVHEEAIEEFTHRFGTSVASLRVGPAQHGNQIGPMIDAQAVRSITALVAGAVADGARVSHRADVPAGLTGHFFAPTVLTDVPTHSTILAEEIFGPVAPIVAWRDQAELITQVNGTEYGLAAYVYSRDLQWALRTAEAIEAGMVGINRGLVSDPAAPFGGFKQSGLGREGAREGLAEFQETQYFSVPWD